MINADVMVLLPWVVFAGGVTTVALLAFMSGRHRVRLRRRNRSRPGRR